MVATLPEATTPIAEAAEMYALAGLGPIRLYGIAANGDCTCPSGPRCPVKNRGKHPIGEKWQETATADVDRVRDIFRSHLWNIGIYLPVGSHVLLDADGVAGLHTAETWNLPDTLTQQSGSGVGAHFIFKLAPHQDAASITDRKVAPGLDVKVRGQFVAAPSRHASGNQYHWVSVRPPAVLPDEIYEKIRKNAVAPPPPQPSVDPSTLGKRAAAYLRRFDPAISGSGGHNQTFAAARGLASWHLKGLSESECWGLLLEYNQRCQPPWTVDELKHKWASAKTAHTLPTLPDRPLRLVRSDEPLPPPPPSGPPDWRQELMYAYDKKGNQRLINHIDNIVRILQLDPKWSGKIAFNSFAQEIECATDLPWDKFHKPTEVLDYWTDQDGTRLAAWLRREWQQYGFDPPVGDCERAVDVVARTHAFHPVRDYLESIVWDGTPRLARWTTTYLGAEDTEYHRTIGRWWLISAVARIYQPGVKVDTVPILEGQQGRKKSTAIAALAGEWFSDAEIDVTNKDAAMLIQGCWLVELGEVDTLMRSEPSEAKRFFSRPSDRFRPPWARRPVDLPRQCVFVGTTNLTEYLSDPTGARRYLPIACGSIDIEAIHRDRDQIWAEAVCEYRDGRKWYPENDADRDLAAEQQAARTADDSWESAIAAFLGNRKRVTSQELLELALQLPAKDWTRQAQMRIGALMARIGWRRARCRDGERLYWAYFRNVPTQADSVSA